MPKFLTVCRQGISRSVGMIDVLKLHFSPVDAVPVGHAENANSTETLRMLVDWADHVILMETHYLKRLEDRIGPIASEKVHICDVGPDIYGGSNRAILIDKVWRWLRANQNILGIKEHNTRL